MAQEELFQWSRLFKLLIALFQNGLVGVVQPVAFTLRNGSHGLGIELAVVDGDIGVDGTGYFDTDKAPAAAGIGQQVFLIAGAYEGGVAAYLLNGGSVWLPQVGYGFLQQMFQETLLADADLVELVDVDQKEAPQASFGILFALEVDAVSIAEAQFRW